MSDLIFKPKSDADFCFEKYLNEVRSDTSQYIESLGLPWLNAPEKILKLFEHSNLVAREMLGYKRKDYLNSADKESRIYNIWFGHELFDRKDEKPQVFNSLSLNDKCQSFHQLMKETEDELPWFLHVDFLAGVLNVIFYELDKKPRKTPYKDYYKMRAFQTHQLLECVRMECGVFRKRFIEKFGDSPQVFDHLWAVKHQFDALFREAPGWSTPLFTAKLLKIEAFLPGSLPDDMEEFKGLFCQFLKGMRFPHALSPPVLRLAHENISAGKISPVPICCWSMIRFKIWLTDVLEGTRDLRDAADYNYEALFEKAFEGTLLKSQNFIDEFKRRYPAWSVQEKKYKSIILNEVKKSGEEFNQLQIPEYFKLLLNKENLKNKFIKDCFLHNDIDYRVGALCQVIKLNEKAKFFRRELFLIDESLINQTLRIAELKDGLSDFISAIFPSPEISEQLWGAFNKIVIALFHRKPFFIIIEELKDAIYKIIHQALSDFDKVLNNQPSHVIEYYMQNQLIELEVLAITKPVFGQDFMEFLKELKKLVKLRLKRSQGHLNSHLANIGLLDFNQDIKEGSPDNHKIVAFNCTNLKEARSLAVMNYLILKKAIHKETTFAHFNSKFNGINGTEPIEWLAPQGDFATFIKELIRTNDSEFAPYNEHWDIASICFVQKGGIPFDPKKLRCSKPTMNAPKFIKAAGMFK